MPHPSTPSADTPPSATASRDAATGRPRAVATPDGLVVAAREHGAAAGPEVLFIHGFSQCGLCWSAQTGSPDLADLRMVAYDTRGHGGSDKPLDAAFYQEAARWADEMAAVISQCGLRRPVVAGWSYAGRIICDYLARHGSGALSGIVFVDAIASNERRYYGTSNGLMRRMTSPDLPTSIAATRAFLDRCFALAPAADTMADLLAANMVVPHQVRAALFGRPADYDGVLTALDLPVLVVQGARDAVVAPAMAERLAALVPGARLERFDDSGHAPFLEEPERFNALLGAFARGVWRPD